MGFNTSCLILNDALGNIERDVELGKKIAAAVHQLANYPQMQHRIDISAGNHVNAMAVFESHHADRVVPLLIGGNHAAIVNGVYVGWAEKDPEISLLQQLASKHGYSLRKKPRKA